MKKASAFSSSTRSPKASSTRDYPTVDGLRASEITFENVEVPAANLIGDADNGLALIERVTDEAIAAHCAGSRRRA